MAMSAIFDRRKRHFAATISPNIGILGGELNRAAQDAAGKRKWAVCKYSWIYGGFTLSFCFFHIREKISRS
jgi:hypothetical protein